MCFLPHFSSRTIYKGKAHLEKGHRSLDTSMLVWTQGRSARRQNTPNNFRPQRGRQVIGRVFDFIRTARPVITMSESRCLNTILGSKNGPLLPSPPVPRYLPRHSAPLVVCEVTGAKERLVQSGRRLYLARKRQWPDAGISLGTGGEGNKGPFLEHSNLQADLPYLPQKMGAHV